MRLKTKHFGEIDYDENSVIIFDEGLPGFRDKTKFILLADGSEDLFHWLQSTEDEDLVFVLMDVKQVLKDYCPVIEPGQIVSLEDEDIGTSSLSCYNITVVPDDLTRMRVNLKAPVMINKKARKGKQVIASNEEYGVRHYIFEEMPPTSGLSAANSGLSAAHNGIGG